MKQVKTLPTNMLTSTCYIVSGTLQHWMYVSHHQHAQEAPHSELVLDCTIFVQCYSIVVTAPLNC